MGMEIRDNGIREYRWGDITVWLLSLEKIPETEFARMYACCSEGRKNAADRIKPELRRRQSLGAGYLLFRLKKRFSIEEDPIALPGGKPVFRENSEICFNISHSGGYAALAFGSTPLGIDIECVRRADLKVAKRFFAKEEYDCLAEKQETEQAELFYQIWTGKEAVLKASGAGLGIPLETFSVIGETAECRGKKYEICRQRVAQNGQILWISTARLII